MFEDIHEIAENSAYLKAIEEKDVSLEMLEQLPPYEETRELEEKLKGEGRLDFNHIFHEHTGFYFIKQFLTSDFAGDKAVFIKDVEAYRNMRFESARLRVAKLLYHRYIADDEKHQFPTGVSIFELLRKRPELKNEEISALRPSEVSDYTNAHAALRPRDDRMATSVVAEEDEDDDGPATTTATTGDDSDEEDVKGEERARVEPLPDKVVDASLYADEEDDPNRPVEDEKFSGPTAATSQQPKMVVSPFTGHHHDKEKDEEENSQGSNGSANGRLPYTQTRDPNMKRDRDTFQIGSTNAIGVYGKSIKQVKEKLANGQAPKNLFDEVAEDVMNDLQHDVFPRFKISPFYKKYIRTKAVESRVVAVKDFQTFRVLGRGGFGSVHACRKINSGALYAMKAINKKLVKVKQALQNVMEERDVLIMLDSKFVTNAKYALQDENCLYLIMDLMLGGDLKFHLINAGRFTEERARFYAAEVLLGLEHIHSLNIIYRDMKLENVLLDEHGHCRLSDLGLAVYTKEKIRGYAGTPGYTAPEMIKNKPYGTSVDIFSYGVMLYRMLCGQKPFKGKVDRDLDKAVVEKEPRFPPEIFTPEAVDILQGLLQKRPEKRLGCGPRGIEEIKEHPFFRSIDWGLLEAGYLDPPFVPNKYDVNAASLKDIGDFDTNKLKQVKLNERFKKTVKRFDHVNVKALQDEMVNVLVKADANIDYAPKYDPAPAETAPVPASGCCLVS